MLLLTSVRVPLQLIRFISLPPVKTIIQLCICTFTECFLPPREAQDGKFKSGRGSRSQELKIGKDVDAPIRCSEGNQLVE